MKTLLLIACTTLCLSACNASNNTKPPKTDMPPAKTEAACQTQGGKWQRVGLTGHYACVLIHSDAGKSCTDSAQCQGRCQHPIGPVPGSSDTPATGTCQATNQPFGCFSEVLKGVIQPGLCID